MFHSPRRVRHLHALSATLSVGVIAGCADVTEPNVQPPATISEAIEDTIPEEYREHPELIMDEDPDFQTRQGEHRSIHDEFADMARELPGGFGGLFYDTEGRLRVVLQEPERVSAVLSQLPEVPMVAEHVALRRGAVGLEAAQAVQGRFDYGQLYDWFRDFRAVWGVDGVTSVGIRVHDNQLSIGVVKAGLEQAEDEILELAAAVDIPAEALLVRGVEPIQRSSLRGAVKPRPAGVQISPEHSSECTLGPNVRTSVGQRGFLMNSHCTREFGVVHHDRVWQHQRYWNMPGMRQIGNEIRDPAVLPSSDHRCPDNNPHGCRYSDAALAGYHDGIDDDYGRIARTTGLNNFSYAIDSSNPRFIIDSHISYPWPGQTIEKVGRTTGWTSGSVQHGNVSEVCSEVTPTEPNFPWAPEGPTILCSVAASSPGEGGDSGSPVFVRGDVGQPILVGMMWGETRNVDEIHMSALFDIEFELGSLSYYPSGGGGDPGDPGEPCEPVPPELECEV